VSVAFKRGTIGAVINLVVTNLDVSSSNGAASMFLVKPSGASVGLSPVVIDDGPGGRMHAVTSESDLAALGAYRVYMVWKPVAGGSFPSSSATFSVEEP
jgi:hypothetical protein